MTDQIIRIKSSRQGYRRGGLVLDREWIQVDTADLSEAHKRAVLQDPVLTIEGRQDDGSWTPLTVEVRQGLAALLQGVSEAEASGVQPEVGTVVDDAELEQLKADAEVGRAYILVIDTEAARLDALSFTDRAPSNLLTDLINVAAEHERSLTFTELGAELSSAIADSEELLTSLGLWPIEEPARFFLRLVNLLVERDGEIDRLKNTPSESQQGGGAGDGAGPAAGEESRQEGPETAGNTSSAGTTPPAEPAPKPKLAATPKPPAKGKGDASKSS